MRKIREMSHRDKVRWKVRLLWALIVVMLAYMVVIGETGGDSRIMTPWAKQFSHIVFFGGLSVVIWRLVYNKRLLKDRLRMKQDAAQKRDERQQYLHDKSGGVAMDALLVCLLFLAMTEAFYNMSAFYMAFATLLLTAGIKALTWCVYNRMH